MILGLGHLEATRIGTTLVAAFLASLVECVEALTVVLAVGSVRGWRSALTGAATAFVVLAGIVAAIGPLLMRIPLHGLTRIPFHMVQLVVGAMILLFGMRWLRKAILRWSGLIAMHDEEAAFVRSAEAIREAEASIAQLPNGTHSLDKFAFSAAFNITMLEGTEVVFVVIAFGAGGAGLLLPASLGAVSALLVVVAAGFALHRPLARVPENTLKFMVGVLLSAFGTFWVGEGMGAVWAGSDLAILWMMAAYLVVALCLVPLCRSRPATVEG